MFYCILELLVLIFDVTVLVHHFTTGKISKVTWVLLIATGVLFIIVVYNLVLDIQRIIKRRKQRKLLKETKEND